MVASSATIDVNMSFVMYRRRQISSVPILELCVKVGGGASLALCHHV